MSKYNYNYNENTYKTPKCLYEKALNYWYIDKFYLDCCCADEHIPAHKYYKLGSIDGLKENWVNYTWCNPPFNECKDWVKKAYEENQKSNIKICLLIPARTETAYWHKYILNNKNVHIDFLKKGFRFLDKNNNEMGIFKNALALVYFE